MKGIWAQKGFPGGEGKGCDLEGGQGLVRKKQIKILKGIPGRMLIINKAAIHS